MAEQRYFSRVDLDTIVLLNLDENKIKGNVVDVSVSGIMIDFDEEIALETENEYFIDLFMPNSTIIIKAKVKMIRQKDKNFGLQFVDLDLGTMFLINTLSSFKKIEVGKYYSVDQIADTFEMGSSHISRYFPDEEISGAQLIEFMDKTYVRLKQ